MTQDIFYYESGYIDSTYFVYTADAESNQTATVSVIAAVGIIKNSTVNLSCNFTQTSTISHLEGADLFAMSNAALAAEVSRIRDNNVSLSGTFSSAIDAARIRYITSEEDVTFSINISNLRVRNEEAAISAVFSLAATAAILGPTGTVIEATGTWTSTSDLTVAISHIEGADLSAFSNTLLTASAFVIKDNKIDSSSQFSQETVANRTRNLVSNQEVTASISTANSRIRTNSANLTSQATLVADNYRIVEFAAVEYSAFTPSVFCTAVKNTFAVLDSQASIFVSAVRTRNVNIGLNLAFTQSTLATKFKDVGANLSSAFTLVAPYLSFKNKRPHSAYRQGTGSYGLTTIDKKYGTGSYYSGSTLGSSTTGIYIPTTGNQNIAANQDFYISIWMNLGSYTVANNPAIVNAGAWSFGYYGSSSQASATYNSTQLLAPDGYRQSPDGWNHWELYRVGSTITFRFTNLNGSPVTTTSTYSGSIDSAQNYVYFKSPTIVTYTPLQAYYDEFFFAKGVSSVGNYAPSGEIADGALPTTQWLYHFNGDYKDDTSGIINMPAVLQSTSSLSAILPNRTRDQSASLQTTATELVAVGRIRPFVDLEVSNFNLTIDGVITKEGQSDLSLTSSLSAVPTKNIGVITAGLVSTTSLTAQGETTSGAVINLQVDAFELVANARIRAEVADLDSAFTISILANKTREASANLSSIVTLTSVIKKTSNTTANLVSEVTLQANTARSVPFIITDNSRFTIDCPADRIRKSTVALSSTATISSSIIVTRRVVANIVSASNLAVDNTRTRSCSADFSAFVTELIIGDRSRETTANLTVTTQLHCSINVLTLTIKADLVATTSLSLIPSRVRDEIAIVAFNSTMSCNAGKKVEAQADLHCEGFEVVIATRINLSTADNWIIPTENRYWMVPRDINLDESIVYIIPKETMSWTIPSETNYYTIELENRTFKIKG